MSLILILGALLFLDQGENQSSQRTQHSLNQFNNELNEFLMMEIIDTVITSILFTSFGNIFLGNTPLNPRFSFITLILSVSGNN